MATLSDCCTSGVPGSESHFAAGKVVEIGGLDTYVSSPTTQQLGTLLLLPDGFGLVQHNFILADLFASKGWKVFLPDYFQGHPIPEAYLRRNPALSIDEQEGWSEEDKSKMRNFALPDFVNNHPPAKIDKLLADWLAAPELLGSTSGTPRFGVGYCFGGKYVLRLAASSIVDAAAAFHPSLVTIDDTKGIRAPVLLGYAEKDQAVPLPLLKDLKASIEKEPAAVDLIIYEGMAHGFGARPNTKDPAVKKQFLKAFEDANNFLLKSI